MSRVSPFPRIGIRRHLIALTGLLLAFVLSSRAVAQSVALHDEVRTYSALSNTTVTMTGRAELHVTGGGDPIPGCTVHLNSENAWAFFHEVTPGDLISTLLPRVRVDATVAELGVNVRVVPYVNGSVVIPHPAGYAPLTVFADTHFTGPSKALRPHVEYGVTELGAFNNGIRSFILKRGYMATLADHAGGTGSSRNYIAQDADLEVPVLPSGIDADISFIRVFPWRWTAKKGSCDVSPSSLEARWHYNWNISLNSTPDWEYVAIKQQPFWPGTDQDWEGRGVTHLSGFNEPDNPVEDAYQNLSPQGSVSDAVARYGELLGTGLRVGAPAVTDAGTGWIADFMNQANAAGVRIDYVPVHYYRSHWNNDPAGAASQMYDFLKGIHDVSQRPVWVTEFNNGANWTDNAHDPSVQENRDVVQAMIEMMDDTPWIERYAVYSRVEWFRQTHYDEGGITPMGAMYRDHESPMAHRQVVPNSGRSGTAAYRFEGDTRDSSGNGNPCLVYGTPRFVAGRHGTALSFDGTDDYLRLAGRFGDASDFTFMAWVRWNGGGNWQRIFDFGVDTSAYLFLTPRSGSNTLRFAIKNEGSEQRLDAPPLPVGVWTHVAVTLSGNTGKLFVNGSLVDTNSSMTINPFEIGTEANYLGKSQWPDPLFRGLLDDVRISNSALGDADVAAAASAGTVQFTSDPIRLPPASPRRSFTSSLAGHASAGSGGRTFAKLAGPAWLAVAADGGLTGVPTPADTGLNTFLV